MHSGDPLGPVRAYFENTLKVHGLTAKGVDWNSDQARALRFEQLIKIIQTTQSFSLLDYGCGYGALVDYLRKASLNFQKYIGYDILPAMVTEAKKLYREDEGIQFTTNLNEVPRVDYAIACGVFNIKLDASLDDWTHYVIDSLHSIDEHCVRGFSVNFLTRYSDPDRMRPDLYYADPCFLFDYCKNHFSRNVALLHDYNLYDFTILVRK